MGNKMKRVEDRDWLNLPSQLLLSILTGFLPTRDAIRFGAVCKEWRSVSLEAKEKLSRRPWQMIESTLRSWGTWVPLGQHKHIHPSTRSGRKLDAVLVGFFQRWHDDEARPGLAGVADLISTSQGWLIQRFREKVFMRDPRTESMIPLPSIPCNNKVIVLSKALVFPSSSSSSSRYTVVAIDENNTCLAVGQVGGEQWMFTEMVSHLDDINYHEGLLYSVSCKGKVLIWDLPSSSSSSSGEATPRAEIPGPVGLDHSSSKKLYIVPASPYGLLLIARYPHEVGVFALADSKAMKWVQVRRLEGHSLFLGRNQSTCLSKMDFPEMKENGIYVTGDILTWKHPRVPSAPSHVLSSKEIYFQRYGKYNIHKIWRDDILPCRLYLRHW